MELGSHYPSGRPGGHFRSLGLRRGFLGSPQCELGVPAGGLAPRRFCVHPEMLRDTDASVRARLAWFAKRRERTSHSHRAFSPCAVSSWESEELDERPHALFLTAARKSLGSCELGDTMEGRPKQFRYNLRLRALPLKQLPELGKRETQLRRSSRVIEWYAQAERKHRFIQCW